MYKVLIADDEEIIRRGLAKLLKKDPELELAAQAEDGETALALALETQPDLLLVDINMPFMNGLEFIEKLKDVLKGAVILVITGYDDFAYAQKALRLGVFDYLLKPVMEEAFYKALNQAKEQFCRNQKQVRYLDWAKLQVEKNRSSLTASFLDAWLEGRYSDTEAAEQLEYLGISIPEPFGVTVAHLAASESRSEVGREWDENLLYYAAENIARETFAPLAPVTTCKNASGDLILISCCRPQENWDAAVEKLGALLEQHLPVRAALTHAQGGGLSDLPQTYDDAMELLRERRRCPQTVVEAQRIIEAHFSEENLSLQWAAEELHVSPQYLSRLFRQETGVTFVDYVTRARIRRAVDLLSSGELKMYEIAERTGYASQHYFSNAFKKVLGVSPLEYRRGANG